MQLETKNNKINTVYNIDARKILETIPLETKISTTITSPPYYDMKDYQVENQIGYGQTYDEYLNDLKSIFESIYNITNDDGSLWIVIDTFKRDNQVVTLPFDLSNKLKDIGWLLQDIIIWKKDKTVPWSTNGFMQRKFEYILFLTKSSKFKSNKDKIRVYDTEHLKRWWVKYPERYNPKGKALDEIWEFSIPIQGTWGDKYIRHFCPLPKNMVANMIQISTDEGDIVLDPFAGSGAVLSQSAYMKRNYIGFELNKSYIQMFENYLSDTLESNIKEYELFNNSNSQNEFEKTILNLRALKYAKNLITHIQKFFNTKDFKIYVNILEESTVKHKLIKVEYNFLSSFDNILLEQKLDELISKRPFSKFGIEPVFKFNKLEDIMFENYYGYSDTNTHCFIRNKDLTKARILSKICVDLNENDYI